MSFSNAVWLTTVGILIGLASFLVSLRWLVYPLLRVLLWTRYRIKVCGLENLPRTGPVLIVANHVTWFDGFFLAATCPRRGRALVNGSYIDFPVFRHFARWIGLIPVPYSGPRAQRALIERCREVLDRGEVLAIFPEGQISRNGLTGSFQRGLEVILSKREHVPVIPVFLDNLWGSMLSFSGGCFLRKWPQGWRRTVTVAYGTPVPPRVTAFRARQAVLETSVHAFELRQGQVRPLETIDPALPHFEHPSLGRLTGSTADFDRGGVQHVGQKPGTVGQAIPGVALRVVDEAGAVLDEDRAGRIEARVAGKPEWQPTGLCGSIDRDGFLRIE